MNVIDIAYDYLDKEKNKKDFYHYTSPEALVNILSKSSIRFTNCMFLNDIEEYNYILELIRNCFFNSDNELYKNIEGLARCLYSEYYSSYDRTNNSSFYFYNDGKKIKGFNGEYYVLSGTVQSDSLPMWAYYSKSESYYGYAIKFNIDDLLSLFDKELGEIVYGEVIYDEVQQIKIICDFTQNLLDKYKECIDDSDIDDLQQEFYDFIQRIRLFYKGTGFNHEKEFRIVILADNMTSEEKLKEVGIKTSLEKQIGYSISKGIIKPYIEYICPDGVPINEIIMSPSIEEEAGTKGLKTIISCCHKKNYENISILKSQLQLRF